MPDSRVTVTCRDCNFERGFDRLGEARVGLERHQSTTGHDAAWTIERLSRGVERAGEAAGVCGRACDVDTPLVADRR
jgi:hypothetical protein